MRAGWFSAYYRGLDLALDMWPVIYEKVLHDTKKAPSFHIFYGWQSWDALGGDPELKPRILKKLKALEKYNVYEHGRVSHAQLAKEMKRTDVWLYPTEFPEINCITALKAQEAKCYPVVTNVGALSETVQSGVKLNFDNIYSNQYGQKRFIDAAAEALILKKRGVPMKNVGWDEIASKWEELLV